MYYAQEGEYNIVFWMNIYYSQRPGLEGTTENNLKSDTNNCNTCDKIC